MDIDPDRSDPELTQPDPIARHAKAMIALVVMLAVAQIEAAQAIPGDAGEVVMH